MVWVAVFEFVEPDGETNRKWLSEPYPGRDLAQMNIRQKVLVKKITAASPTTKANTKKMM